MSPLPPGQQAISSFPRFGLPQYASRLVPPNEELRIEIGGAVETEGFMTADSLASLPRVEQISDFHCVTTWSKTDLRWGGYRFADVYEQILKPLSSPDDQAAYLFFRCLDGYKTAMLLSDLLVDDVMLADSVNGEPLGSAHGAPMRLVAPQHYGYKNPKHIKRVEFRVERPKHSASRFRFIDHPRARVALEERGSSLPGWLLRRLYRPLIGPSMWLFGRQK